MKVTDEMVSRFLAWKLPEDFSPDCGVTFKPIAQVFWPTGTNLLNAVQARRMLEHVLGGEAQQAGSGGEDGSTPGLWRVEKRERNGELVACWVAAPDCNGFSYDAEILGDDEYRDGDEAQAEGMPRRLADCELIVKAVNAYRASCAAPAEPARSVTDDQIDAALHKHLNQGGARTDTYTGARAFARAVLALAQGDVQ